MMDRENNQKGLLLINTGDGKGKTTAAIGVLFRAWGRGMKVCMIQFLKHESGGWGEVRAAQKLGIEWIKTGDGFTWTSKDMDETIAKVLHGWQIAKEKIASGEYDVIVLDEFTYLLSLGWLPQDETLDWLRANKPSSLHLIITGRYASTALRDMADLVTEMTKVKHPFDVGIQAQPGVEF
jgi:cob(I)alamin adenosyltransferase